MPGCSWNFFSEPFCEMHSVVTVKTVVNFNDANIFCTTRNKIRSRQFVMTNEPLTKNPKVSLKQKKWKITAMLVNVTKKVFLKKNMMLVNQPSKSAITKDVRKKRGIERQQCLWMRWSEIFLKDKTWCLWSNHANQQATNEGSQKVYKKKGWKGTQLVNVMINIFLKDKTWRSWSPARDRWWAHSTTHWQSRLSHSRKYQSSPSAYCGSCKKNKAVTARPDSYGFRCATLVASKTINVSG